MDRPEFKEDVSISIIIPVFNRAEILPVTLKSIMDQTYSEWECIIVDDLSTDNTPQVISEFQKKDFRFRFFSRHISQPKGPSICRNIGIKKANGKYVMFIDSDDFIYPECLKNRLEFSIQHRKSQFWIFKTETRSSSRKTGIFNKLPQAGTDEAKYYKNFFLNGEIPFHTMSPFWLRSELLLVRGFDPQFQLFEDPELHLRYLLQNPKVKTDIVGLPDSIYNVECEEKKDNDIKRRQRKVLFYKYLFGLKFKNEIREYQLNYFENALRELAFPYNSRRYVLKFLKTGLTSQNLSISFSVKCLILSFYHFMGIQDKKNIGYYSVRNWVFKQEINK